MKTLNPLNTILSCSSMELNEKTLRILLILVILFKPHICKWYKQYKLNNKVKANVKNAGRKSFDIEKMFYLLIIKELYNYSDKQTVQYLADSNMLTKLLQFAKIPAASTLWHYKSLFSKSNLFSSFFKFVTKKMCNKCVSSIEQQNVLAAKEICKHVIIDSTFFNANMRRDSIFINEQIKNKVAKEELYPSQQVASHKDTDADFSRKHNKLYFGYKQHIACDAITKLVLELETTPASVHDVKLLIPLTQKVKAVAEYIYADTGYIGKEFQEQLANIGITPRICRRATRSYKLDKDDITWNNNVSKIRCRVEHIFSGHNNRKRFCSYNAKYASMATLIQYTIYNVKRSISILTNKCQINTISGEFFDLYG